MTQARKLLNATLLACTLGVFGQGCADSAMDEESDDSLAQAASLDGAVVTPTSDGGTADAGDAGPDAGRTLGTSVDGGITR